MNLLGNKQPFYEFAREHLRKPDGSPLSARALQHYRKSLPIVMIRRTAFVDLDRLQKQLDAQIPGSDE